MTAAYFQRWRNSNMLENLHRKFDGKTVGVKELDAAYKAVGLERPKGPFTRRRFY